MTTVGLLSTREHPLLPYFAESALNVTDVQVVLILDAKGLSQKDRALFEERTAGKLPLRDVERVVDRGSWILVPDHNAPETCTAIVQRRIPLLLNAGTPRRIGPALLATAPVINVHPGLVPRYRGATSFEWAVYNNDPVGVTAHFMDLGLDSGPVILQRELDLARGVSYVDARVALYQLTLAVSAEAIGLVLRERLHPRDLPAQPEGTPLPPIPKDLLITVQRRLERGEYAHAR